MKRIILGVMLLVMAGCGDTINQVSPVAGNNKLVIKAATFNIYTTSLPQNSTTYIYNPDGSLASSHTVSNNSSISGTISYEGDPQGAVLFLHGYNKGELQYTAAPTYSMQPEKQLSFYMEINRIDASTIYSALSFTEVFSDPHGNDSNTFPMTLTPP